MPGSTVTVRRVLKDGSVKTYKYERRLKKVAPGQGSLAWLVREYYKSPDFTQLKPQSQRVYRSVLRYIDPIRNKPLGEVKRAHLRKIRDRLSNRPGIANLFVSVIGAVYRYALECGYREDFNPADHIRPLEMGVGAPWPVDALEAAQTALEGSLRMAFLLGLYTAQRRGDVLKMTWRDYDGECIRVVQQKTGRIMDIPVAPPLKAVLDSASRDSVLIVGLTPSQFAGMWPRAMKALGFPGLKFHGLRHTALTFAAEGGATESELQAYGGHSNAASLQRYIKAARQKKLAMQGLAKVFDFAAGAKGQKRDETA
jgi:integrase